MCGAVKGGPSLEGVDVANQAVIQGVVVRGDEPVGNAYVRLLDRTGEFTAEVPTSATGQFRFFAGPGEWTLRTLAPRAEAVDLAVAAAIGVVADGTTVWGPGPSRSGVSWFFRAFSREKDVTPCHVARSRGEHARARTSRSCQIL